MSHQRDTEHRRAARKHAKSRLAERHDVVLSHDDLERLNLEQAQGDPSSTIRLRDLRDYRELRLVRIGNKWVKAIWDHYLTTVVTFLDNFHLPKETP